MDGRKNRAWNFASLLLGIDIDMKLVNFDQIYQKKMLTSTTSNKYSIKNIFHVIDVCDFSINSIKVKKSLT
jgi:hypothetical protein